MSQTHQLLTYLRDGYSVTPLTALQLIGSLRLSERVREAEQMLGSNERIERTPVKVGQKRVMEYRLVRA